jgi:hypothetical protein
MALMTRELKASFAFVERNFNLTKRYWGWKSPSWSMPSRAPWPCRSSVPDRGRAAAATLVIGAVFWNYRR